MHFGAGLLEPVTDKVRLSRDAVAVEGEEVVHVVVLKLGPQPLAPEERWVADYYVGRGPLGLPHLAVPALDYGVQVEDVGHGAEDGLLARAESVLHHPLQVPYPDGYLG